MPDPSSDTSSRTPSPMPHPFAELLGFEVTERGDGRCRVELAVDARHMNPHGLVHGAVLYALADTGMGGALSSVLDEGEICTTIEIKINYLRPWKQGVLRCDTRVVSRGRTMAMLQSDLFDGEDRHLALATGTFAVVRMAATAGRGG
jgi:acyl-CoA thioesterase